MAFLEWTHDLDINVKQIDEQHKQIVSYINILHEAQVSGDHSSTGAIIDELVQYTVKHFADEEALMEQAGYPLTDAHKGVHQRFVEKVAGLQAQHRAGVDTVDALLELLENWLFSHIRMNDHGYMDSMRSAGIH